MEESCGSPCSEEQPEAAACWTSEDSKSASRTVQREGDLGRRDQTGWGAEGHCKNAHLSETGPAGLRTEWPTPTSLQRLTCEEQLEGVRKMDWEAIATIQAGGDGGR